MKLQKVIVTFVKLAAVIGINAAILTVLASDEERLAPQEAQADIADFNFGASFENTTTDVIVGSGLTPRAYEVNGNIVHFAVGETSMRPRRVLEHYQRSFVNAGINSKQWLENPQQKTMGDVQKYARHKEEIGEYFGAMMDGEVVPYIVSEDYVAMGGPVIKGESIEELFDEWGLEGVSDPNNVMKGWRFIDADRLPSGRTRVTSAWSDKEFDVKAFNNPNKAKLGVNDRVPACPGCTLLTRTKSLQKEEPVALEQYRAKQSPQALAQFYVRAMTGRGWELSDTTQVMDYMATKVPQHPYRDGGRFLTFSKGQEHVTYTFIPSDTGTIVTATETW